LEWPVLAKGSPEESSGRHSDAARVSENIRSRRRAAIFAAPVSSEMLYFRHSTCPFLSPDDLSLSFPPSFSSARKSLARPCERLARDKANYASPRVIKRGSFVTELAKVSFMGEL
jgi:hypothetical protein